MQPPDIISFKTTTSLMGYSDRSVNGLIKSSNVMSKLLLDITHYITHYIFLILRNTRTSNLGNRTLQHSQLLKSLPVYLQNGHPTQAPWSSYHGKLPWPDKSTISIMFLRGIDWCCLLLPSIH